MATIADLEELAIKSRLLDVEEREITIGFQRHNRTEVYRPVSSFLIGGMTQQGKSVIAAYFACQFVLCGARLICIDPHCENKKRGLTYKIEPLREWFALTPVDFSDIDEVISRFAWLEAEYTRRKQPGGMQNAFPLLTLIDEFNEFLTGCGLSKQQKAFVSQVVSNVARGGAKHGLFVGIILHNSDVSKSGGSEVRYNITTRIAVNCESREQCKILDYDDKNAIEEQCIPPLQPGDALVKLPGYPPHVFTWPHVTREYCELVAKFVRKIEFSVTESGESESDFAMPSLPYLTHLTSDAKTAKTGLIEPSRSSKVVQNNNLTGISKEEYQAIVSIGNRMIQEFGCVYRKRMQKELGWNSYQYKKIEIVCNSLNWTNKMTKKELTTEEKEAMKQQAGKCAECGATDNLEIDHVWPRSLGGPTTGDNLQVLCKSCNQKKGATHT